MRTAFTPLQLVDPETRHSAEILRHCVECGTCQPTCPSFVVLNNEDDSPRGRNVLIRDMLQSGGPPDAATVTHIDRCLSCSACVSACLAGVDFMHLVDHARAHIEATYRRPWLERALRALVSRTVTNPGLFRLAIRGAAIARPFAALLPPPLRAMIELAPRHAAPESPVDRPQVLAAEGPRRYRVAMLTGCAQRALEPSINEATVRLLRRHGCEVVIAPGAACCGALPYHMGRRAQAKALARANIRAWSAVLDEGGLDAVIVNASGCGTTVKDYGFIFGDDPAMAGPAARIAGLAKDISEFLDAIGLRRTNLDASLAVAYHAPCSLQHAQKVRQPPRRLLADAGFRVLEIPEGHLCCGSAGTYNLLQPEVSGQLRARKLANIDRVGPDVVATSNIGCMAQLACGAKVPVLHVVQLLDWATGGPAPTGIAPGAAAAE
ncbi:MAG: glycolate oxidase subunit GlcF [Alphaproteobacteria bacterium]|nr:glycolate oxidase subunit GlcF [Alphaproteobacteria bacterium]